MTMRKLPQDAKPTTVVANDPEDRKGTLTAGTDTLANQAVQALWVKKSGLSGFPNAILGPFGVFRG